jgi:LuxR family maltose regulon positive regulatory protein
VTTRADADSAGGLAGGPGRSGPTRALDAKFRPPRVRPGIVPRTALVESARVEARRGNVAQARATIARSLPVRPLLTYAVPSSAQILLQVANAYVELADPAGAKAVLREVRDILRQRPDLGVIPRLADDVQGKIAAFGKTTAGASSLTAAELRLLPFLATYLSLAAIAERLHVSRNTVKSQTVSIYQKLGASSRNEANQRVAELGLLGSYEALPA